MLERARAIQDPIIRWRREIHQHPEIGFTETQTAALVAQAMRCGVHHGGSRNSMTSRGPRNTT